MEALYLLCSFISTTSTSIILSIFLLLRHLSRRLLFKPNPAVVIDGGEDDDVVSFYQGTVWHERRRPVHHSFRYSVRYALFDLDNCSQVPPPDHLSANQVRLISKTNGPVFLLTIPPNVGYEQNPLSVYYCYDAEGATPSLQKCIAEVTNTPWGERALFLFNPYSDLVAKPLHVSPFMDMQGNWSMRASAPGDDLSLVISVQHPDLGNYFTATLTAKKVSSQTVGDQALFFWLMPHKVALWIYWHALKLWWKNVAFIQHPRYHNPRYKEIAVERDGRLQCCSSSALGEHNNQNANGRVPNTSDSDLRGNNRCFTWRDANWPWC